VKEADFIAARDALLGQEAVAAAAERLADQARETIANDAVWGVEHALRLAETSVKLARGDEMAAAVDGGRERQEMRGATQAAANAMMLAMHPTVERARFAWYAAHALTRVPAVEAAREAQALMAYEQEMFGPYKDPA
jgi:hypothetical protein